MSEFKKPGGESYKDPYDRWSPSGRPSSEEDARIQHEISKVMDGVVRHDARHNVHDRSSVAASTPSGEREERRVRGTAGEGEPKPRGNPLGTDIIDRLVNQMQPHGNQSKAS
jgi:hypothetical protein